MSEESNKRQVNVTVHAESETPTPNEGSCRQISNHY